MTPVFLKLSHKGYTDRSFGALKDPVGGYSEDEIKQLLHEVGTKKSGKNKDGKEWWYLSEREQEHIEKREKRT